MLNRYYMKTGIIPGLGLAVVFALGLSGCANDSSTSASSATAADAEPKDVQTIISENIGYVPPMSDRGDSYAPAVPVVQNAYTTALVKDYWVFEFYVIKDVIDVRFRNIGRWFKFDLDGTFRTGRWDEETGVGSWKFEYRVDKPYIVLDSNIKGMDEIFQIQALNSPEDAFALTGTTKNADGIHIKMIRLGSMPTRSQFGY